MLRHVDAGTLRVAYREFGPSDGWPVVLLHGFPYDIHAYDVVALTLAQSCARVIVPYLRGFGPTRFRSTLTMRSGQQAALASDLLALLNALEISSAVLAGFDWGGRAACIVAALWPDRVQGLVSTNGYNIHNIAAASEPAAPGDEHRYWYQYYLHGERGKLGLRQNRYAFCRLLWRLWSPTWDFVEDDYARTASSFDNPDFVEIVVHSYRHRFGLIEGDAQLAQIERQLAAQPPIAVPTITLDGQDDGVVPSAFGEERRLKFTARFEHRRLVGVGHNPPQEAPDLFADLVLTLRGWTQQA
jgi:pimeloyl-ACP methyl ester carboxylesterase